MHRFPSFLSIARRLGTTGLLLIFAALAAGCTTITPPQAEVPAGNSGSVAEASPPALIPVARYGRYTLVEMVPEPAQRDLLRQVIEISIPRTLDASVGDALRHVLLRTGYRLCDAPDAASLFTLPLPAAHLRLGPLPLRDALLVLAGSAWELSVDDASRSVCFTRAAASRSASASPAPATPSSSAPVAEPAQLEESQP